MRLTDDNVSEYKKHYSIPDDFSMYRQYYHFGDCPSFRHYWTDGKGKWFADKDLEKTIFILGGVRFDGWQALREHLRDVWRPHDSDGRDWYCDNVAYGGR